MKYTCPHCSKQYDFREDILKPGGTKLRCRQCGEIMEVPPAGKAEIVDLPATARGRDEDIVSDFDLIPSKPTVPPSGRTGAKAGKDAAGFSDLPAPKTINILDDAFMLEAGATKAGIPVKAPSVPPQPTLPIGAGTGAAEPPTVRSAVPVPRVPGARVASKESKKTIAGMPALPIRPSSPPQGQPLGSISDLEAPFGAIDLPAPLNPATKVAAAPAPGEFEFASRVPDPSHGIAPVDARPPALKHVPASGPLDDFALDLPVPAKPAPERSSHMREPTPLPPVLAGMGSGSVAAKPEFPGGQAAPAGIGAGIEEPFGGLDFPSVKPAAADSASTHRGSAMDLDFPVPAPAGGKAAADPFGAMDLRLPAAPPKVAEAPRAESAPFDALDMPPAAPSLPTLKKSIGAVERASSARDIFAEITNEIGDKGRFPSRPPSAPASMPMSPAMSQSAAGPAPLAGLGAAAALPPLDLTRKDASTTKSSGEAGGMSFGEISLTEDATSGGAASGSGVDLPDLKHRASSRGAEASLDLDTLATDAGPGRSSQSIPLREKKKAPAAVTEGAGTSRGSRLVLMLLLLVAIVGGGASLYFTGLWYDAYKAGSRMLGRDIDAINAKRQQFLDSISKELAGDDRDAYSAGRDRLRKSLASSSDPIVRAYLVYLLYTMEVRFGESAEEDKLAESEIRKLALGRNLGREQILAISAQKIFHGKDVDSALQQLGTLSSGRKIDTDALGLVGLGKLEKGDGQGALYAYDALAKIEGDSGRVMFGRVRSLLVLGRAEEAETALASLIAAHDDHMDGKILKAKLFIKKGAVKQAEVLLGGIEKVGGEALGPGQRSTVEALLGRIYLERQENGLALEKFEEAEKLDSRNVEAIIGLGTIDLQKRETAKALARFKMAAAIAPDSLDAHLGLAECQILLADFTEARALLKSLLAKYPAEYRVHHLIGELSVALKEYDQAVMAFQKAIELNGAYLPSYLSLATLYFKQQRVSDAMTVLEEAKQKLPPTANLHAAFGQGFMERGDLDGATKEIDLALEAEPEHVQAHFLKGMVLYRQEDYEGAEKYLNWVVEHEPEFPGLVLQQGLLHEALGNLGKAEEFYAKALAADPDDPEIVVRTASIFISVKKYEEARTLLDKVLGQDPNNAEALFFMGRVVLGEGNTSEALKYFKSAIKFQGEVSVYHLYLAIANETNASYGEALEAADKAVELDGELALARLVRGRLLVRLGAMKDGTADLLKALELKPDLSDAYAPLGTAAESLRQWSEAIEYYRKAIAAEPENGEVLMSLALLLVDRGEDQEARGYMQKAVALGRKMDPGPKWFFTALYYLGMSMEEAGNQDGAKGLYKEYLDTAPLQAIDRTDVEKRYGKLLKGY